MALRHPFAYVTALSTALASTAGLSVNPATTTSTFAAWPTSQQQQQWQQQRVCGASSTYTPAQQPVTAAAPRSVCGGQPLQVSQATMQSLQVGGSRCITRTAEGGSTELPQPASAASEAVATLPPEQQQQQQQPLLPPGPATMLHQHVSDGKQQQYLGARDTLVGQMQFVLLVVLCE